MKLSKATQFSQGKSILLSTFAFNLFAISGITLLNIISPTTIAQPIYISETANYRKRFDIHMENLEKEFRRDNLPAACIQAKKAAKVIVQNRSGLNRLEPDYNWKEIERVLLEVPRKFCSKDVKAN